MGPKRFIAIAGNIGAGKTELLSSLFGLYGAAASGEFRLDGRARKGPHSPAEAIRRGLGLVTADRQKEGLIPLLSVQDNMLLGYHRGGLARRGVLDREAGLERCRALIGELSIQTLGPEQPVSALSGGNQQKVLLARALLNAPRVLLLDEPTRGIDVGAKSEIYRLMRGLADAGVAVLMISSDMEEVIGVSDRVAVMHEGRISGILDREQCSEENILRLAVGKGL